MSSRLWDKGSDLDAEVHAFTVGDDPVLDLKLVHWDCVGSAAHARMLGRIGLLSGEDVAVLVKGLAEIDRLHVAGAFEIMPEQEDVHTAIENWLTEHVGEAGEKIHTGRSRNDQVATAMRLWMRDATYQVADGLFAFVEAALDRADEVGTVVMPGYTHLQRAMPSSVGLWLQAFVEAGLEQVRACEALLDRLDACPLGSGAGFGVPLPLDRAFSADLMGFSRVQRSVIDVQNGRGRCEMGFLRLATDVGAVFEKLACDVSLFMSTEFGFFGLPDALTTGSSIMPQKRNPDVVELLRGRCGRIRGYEALLAGVIGKLPSNYHRDLQLTKRPVFDAADDLAEISLMARRVVESLTVNEDRLRAAMSSELYATAATYQMVREGMPFRQAYRKVADQVRTGRFAADDTLRAEALDCLDVAGQLAEARGEMKESRDSLRMRRDSLNQSYADCLRSVS